ncbi:nuclear transport factor 2 family protein [Stenotrophomonas lacuserhaii]|uniref:nuclear transport factor 2 family protein n=1 Tax=Stenotrophomonas lacuserhaii TaxID=2760084 RepID=UPI0032EE7661
MSSESLEQRLQHLEDRAAIKDVVDRFSNLADAKDIATQVRLFTDGAVVETYFQEALFARMQGRKEIQQGFSSFIASFGTMYHINGQLVIELDGDTATGQHYCQVMLIASVNGKATINTNGVIYHDSYVRTADGWKIAERVSHFTWTNTAAMSDRANGEQPS